jgi:ATP-dependent RNA helicase DeaD
VESFESSGIRPELVEALAAQGYEVPTSVQSALIPVVRRGGSVIVEAGPGSGAALGIGLGVLDRVAAEGDARTPRMALVATASDTDADALALSLAPLGDSLDIPVAALGSGWASPETATLLCGSVADVAERLRAARLSLADVKFVAVHECHEIEKAGLLSSVELLLETVRGAQVVLMGLPLSEAVEDLARRVTNRAVHVPPKPQDGRPSTRAEGAGRDLSYRVVTGDPLPHLVELIGTRLTRSGYEHVLVHFRSDDQAADAGDRLATLGYTVGPPGDRDATVWLAGVGTPVPDGLGAPVASIAYEVPTDADILRQRCLGMASAATLVRPRELPHLRRTAGAAGVRLKPEATAPDHGLDREIRALGDRLEVRLRDSGLAPFMLLSERLSERFDPMEIAAAALSVAFERTVPPEPVSRGERPAGAARPQTWTRLFLSVGERDGVRPGDLLGAVAGESGIEGNHVGKIDIHDTYTLIDVDTSVAERVVKAVNGITIRGRSVRADFDRGSRSAAGRRPAGGRSRDRT